MKQRLLMVMGRGVGHREISALAVMSVEYVGVAVRADSPIRSGRQLIDMLKKDPQSIAFGVANSLGNANHQTIALAMKAEGMHPAKARTVVFQSGANAITALLGGHVQVVPASVCLWVGPTKAGQARQNYQSDEFIAGAKLSKTVDALYTQLRGLLTDLDLVKK